MDARAGAEAEAGARAGLGASEPASGEWDVGTGRGRREGAGRASESGMEEAALVGVGRVASGVAGAEWDWMAGVRAWAATVACDGRGCRE